MMRKFTFTLLMVLVFGSFSFGQDTYTAMLQTKTASPNESVSVNLDVTGFTAIGSFQFFIQADPAVLSFQNVTNFSQSGLVVQTQAGGIVKVLWTNTTNQTFGTGGTGTLLTFNFTYNGLSSPIAFITSSCEVSRIIPVFPYAQTLTGTFTDGGISPVLNNPAVATIDDVLSPLGTVQVPLKYTGFASLVGSITQRVSYDPTKLTFISVTGTGNLASGFNANAAAGIITITWTNVAGKMINYPGNQFNLNFSYINLVTTNVNFSTGCVITTTAAGNIPVTYEDGSVAPGAPITSFASLPVITNAVQGQIVDMPLTFSGMPAGTNNFNVNLTYDNPRMSLIGIYNPMFPVTSNVNGSNISISYVNPSAPDINGQFLVLRFMYNGVGTASVAFTNGCQFNNGSPVGVGYTNGSVSPAAAIVNANIGFVTAVSPSQVAIPVTFTDIPVGTNIGAVTMNIGFDPAKLTFVNSTNPNGATVQLTGSVLHIAWSTTTPGVIVNGTPFITLNFNYSASGNSTTLLTFADGSQLASLASPYPIIPANWNYGGVNVILNHTISGYLAYNSSPSSNLPIAGATVYLKDGPEPLPTSSALPPNIIATATTDVNGYYSISVPNGTYYLYASNTAPWAGIDQADVINLRRYIANLLPNTIYGFPLRVRAADINQDGTLDNGDVIPLRRRIANLLPNTNYLAPDWMFENPMVVVSGSNLPGIDFLGICSGDVNGSYPN